MGVVVGASAVRVMLSWASAVEAASIAGRGVSFGSTKTAVGLGVGVDEAKFQQIPVKAGSRISKSRYRRIVLLLNSGLSHV